MAGSDKKVSYEVGAEAGPFEAGMQKAADSARNAAGQIDSNFRKVQDAFGAVQKQLLLLAGVVAGGAFFKEAIAQSIALEQESLKLSRAFGLNSEEAAALGTALGDVESSGDEYISTFTKFARQLKSNEEGLRALGLQTRDANGNLRDSRQLFSEALQSVSQYKAGLDQNTYAQTLFGKEIGTVMNLQRLNNEVLEDAKRKNQELGLAITQDNVQASVAYRAAMNDVGDVMTAVKKVVGDAVMPVFTELANYFASTGPYVVQVFRGAMMGLLVVFEVVKGAIKTLAGAVFETISAMIDGAGLIGEVFTKLFSGDFSGAYQAAQRLGSRMGQAVTNTFRNFMEAGDDVGAAVKGHFERLYGEQKPADVPASARGTKRMGEFKKDGNQSAMQGWEAELSEAKIAYQEQQNVAGTFYRFSKEQEADFWREKLAITQAGSADNLGVRKRIADLELAINTDSFNRQLAQLATQEAAFKQNMAARLQILEQQAAIVGQRFGQESKEYEEVQKRIVEAKRQAAEQIKQIDIIRSDAHRSAQVAELQLAQQQAQIEYDLHLLSTDELLQLQAQFERRRFEIELEGLKEREQIALTDPDRNPVELERIHQQMEQAEQQHQLRLGEIKNQATRQQTKYVTDMYSSIESGFARVIAQAMRGGMTLAGFFRAMWQQVVQAVINGLAQMAAEWIVKTILKKLLSKSAASSEIAANAAVAGSGAYAAIAAIPFVGPFLAPAAAATAYGGAMAFQAGLASAEGGYDIPGTINPIVQTHANEMILPAKHADVIRRMADEGEEGGAARQPRNLEVKLEATPMGRDFFMVHRDQLVRALRSAHRDFAV